MTLITAQWSLIKTLPTLAARPPAPAIGPSCARRSALTGRGSASVNRPHRPCSAQQPARLSHWKAGHVHHQARPFPPRSTPPTCEKVRGWKLPLAAAAATHPARPAPPQPGPPHCWAWNASDWSPAARGGESSRQLTLPLAPTAVRLVPPVPLPSPIHRRPTRSRSLFEGVER